MLNKVIDNPMKFHAPLSKLTKKVPLLKFHDSIYPVDQPIIQITQRDLANWLLEKYGVPPGNGFCALGTNKYLADTISNQPSSMTNQTSMDKILEALEEEQAYHNKLTAMNKEPIDAAFIKTNTPFSEKIIPAKDVTAEDIKQIIGDSQFTTISYPRRSRKKPTDNPHHFVSIERVSVEDCVRFDMNEPGFISSGQCLTFFEKIIGEMPKKQHPMRPPLNVRFACSNSFFNKNTSTNKTSECATNTLI